MGRFHDALQQLADVGYFAMEPTEPIVQDIPVPSNLDEQASTSAPPSHPIEIAANLPQLEIAAPAAAGLPVDSMVELSQLDHDDDQEVSIFKPIVIDAGVRRAPLRTPVPVVESEQSRSDDKTDEPSEADVDSISPIGRLEQIRDDLDSITRDETSDDLRLPEPTSMGDVDSNVAPRNLPESTDTTATPGTVASDSESVAAGVDEPIVAELADVHNLVDHFDWGPFNDDSAEEPETSTDRPQSTSMVQLVQRVLGFSSNDQMTTQPPDAAVGPDREQEDPATQDQDSTALSIAGADGRVADQARREPTGDAPAEPDASFEFESPYRPVLDRWAVFPDEQDDLPKKNEWSEESHESPERNPVEPIVASDIAAEPSDSADRLTDIYDPAEQQAQVDRPGNQAAGSIPFPPTEYEVEITERLRTPSYVERIQKLSGEIATHSVGGAPCIVLFVSLDTDHQRADAATALALNRYEQQSLPTLLIDADIDSRRVSRGYQSMGAGLIEAISGQLPWGDSVRQTSSEYVRLLPCGTDIGFVSPDSEQEEFKQIAQFAEQWRKQYGLVLIDGGLIDSPLVPVLTRASDATFVYVQLGKSRRAELAAAVERIEKAGGYIQGCITTSPAT